MTDLIVSQMTAMVITYNEAPNIQRCLERLEWAPRVLLIDSGSNDATLQIARRFRNVDVVQRPFDDFAGQCNFGLSCIESPWVLSLDADYELTLELVDELCKLKMGGFSAYEAAFLYCIYGRPLRGTLYPDRRILYQRQHARYRNEGHGHRIEVDGLVGRLKGKIRHDDRKPLARWLASQQKYAAREADYLLGGDLAQMNSADRIRLMGWVAPIVVFFYTLIYKGCLIDGWPGWLYVVQRTLAELMISLEIVDRKLRVTAPEDPCGCGKKTPTSIENEWKA
jgi:glycosyltransferase involved in cell wall biosynthesis